MVMNVNPWKEVALSDYENHMKLSEVYQLQTLASIMREQFSAYPVSSVAVLGVAGGNGLESLEHLPGVRSIFGVDINPGYLETSAARLSALGGRYSTVLADICDPLCSLPEVEMVVANLFIEYVGYEKFSQALLKMKSSVVSCVIQIDPAESFVSQSPYAEKLEILDSVHVAVDADMLIRELAGIGYALESRVLTDLPNGKKFCRLDFRKV